MPDLLATITPLRARGPVDPDAVMAATADCGSEVTRGLRELLRQKLEHRDQLRETARSLGLTIS